MAPEDSQTHSGPSTIGVAAGLDLPEVSGVERAHTIVAAHAAETVAHDVLPRYDLSTTEVDEGLSRLHASDGAHYTQRHTMVVAAKRAKPIDARPTGSERSALRSRHSGRHSTT